MKPESRLKSTFQSFIGILLISVVARQSQTTSHLTSDTLSPRGWYLVPKSLVGLKLLVNMRPSLSIFSSSCWVHLCLLTAHCLQCKRWMSQSQRDLALLVCEIFFFLLVVLFLLSIFFPTRSAQAKLQSRLYFTDIKVFPHLLLDFIRY